MSAAICAWPAGRAKDFASESCTCVESVADLSSVSVRPYRMFLGLRREDVLTLLFLVPVQSGCMQLPHSLELEAVHAL